MQKGDCNTQSVYTLIIRAYHRTAQHNFFTNQLGKEGHNQSNDMVCSVLSSFVVYLG